MNANPDRLYALLPPIYRIRDAQQGYPLQALLRVIAEQVDVVEQDIAQLYDNWFIETAQDWAVPYIADLIGYRPIHEAGEPGDVNTTEGPSLNKILIPRREVANTIHYRRSKGALALLETLTNDVAGWPARAVEFFRLLGWTQNLNHRHLDRARTVNVRDGDALELLDGPFNRLAHTVDIRRMNSAHTPGRYNIPSVGVFVWRLKAYPVTQTPAYCLEQVGTHCYTFSALGQDTPLYVKPQPETDPAHIAGEVDLPVPIRRRPFERHIAQFHGEGLSLAIYADWAGHDLRQPLPAQAIIAADLSDWTYIPPRNCIAVDPVLGRIAFPPKQLPKKVRVSYHYAFSDDIGGGEYDRPLVEPPTAVLYRVGAGGTYQRLGEALQQWRHDQPVDAVIEFTDSSMYSEPVSITLPANHSLQLRAANHVRPIIRLIDWQTDQPDSLNVTMASGSRFTLDGLLITGRPVQINGAPQRSDKVADRICQAELTIRHCTLVPGWGLDNDCEPLRPAEPSLELNSIRAQVTIQRSILGTVQVNEDEVRSDPIPIHISDSIVDAMRADQEAMGAPGNPVAHAVLTIQRSTVFGMVQVHAIELAENSIFSDCVHVARRQLGCMRFCYVPPACRTPRRFSCQPDLVEQAAEASVRAEALKRASPLSASDLADRITAAKLRERMRVRPEFNSVRYSKPAYCQLAETCVIEIQRGADDESEMGVFHDLYQPQREANLHARLNEYTPAGANVGIIFAS